MERTSVFTLRRLPGPAALLGLLAVVSSTIAADAPSVKLALSFRPVQKGIEYETPAESEYSQCKVQVERKGKSSGWIVYGPNGQTLRRFVDTNADNVVDQWRYYEHGIEVYRDIDSNFNNKVDQCRWLNSGGSRWGLDSDEDGAIDSWKVLSAEEASREAVRALASGDVRILRPLLITAADLKALSVEAGLQKKVLDSVSSPETKLKAALSAMTGLSSKTQWVRFNASQPGVIPADEGKAERDLTVYENAMAITETDGKAGLVQVGEIVRVGEVWKLTQVPQPVGENTQVAAGGLLMQPEVAGGSASTLAGNLTPEMQKLLQKLQELDRKAPQPSAGARAFAEYNARRSDILQQLIDASKSEKDRGQWRRQMIDGIAASVQTGAFPEGLKKLETVETSIRREDPKSDLLPYATYRRLLAEYTVRLQKATAKDRPRVQTWWLKQLEDFADTWPRSEDAPEAMMQLATGLEFGGDVSRARKWYEKSVAAGPRSHAGERAAGALRRLDLNGNQLELSGKGLSGGSVDVADYRGKVLLVIFWSTWCKPCTEDLPQIKALYGKYRAAGFEVLGVNLDVTAGSVRPYLAQHGVPWKHIREEGGLDSPPARRYGIISLPTMFLVDRSGKVVSRSTSVEMLKKSLPSLLKAARK